MSTPAAHPRSVCDVVGLMSEKKTLLKKKSFKKIWKKVEKNDVRRAIVTGCVKMNHGNVENFKNRYTKRRLFTTQMNYNKNVKFRFKVVCGLCLNKTLNVFTICCLSL